MSLCSDACGGRQSLTERATYVTVVSIVLAQNLGDCARVGCSAALGQRGLAVAAMTSIGFPALALVAALVCVSLVACARTSNHTSATHKSAPAESAARDAPTPSTPGDAGLSGKTVAKVGRYTIATTAVKHWMSVLVVTDRSDIPKTRDPGLAVPQPPNYTTCVTHAKIGLARVGSHPTVATLTRKCALLRQALQEEAIELLISTEQLIGKAAVLDIAVNDSEARQQLSRLKPSEFPTEAAFRRYLRLTNQSVADQFYRVKNLILADKLIATVAGGPHHTPTPAQQREFAEISKKWIARTSCRTGYVVALCRQYAPSAGKPPAVNVLIAELAL
jgi:hypothetical protein